MKKIAFYFVILIAFNSCNKQNQDPTYPDCIQEHINNFVENNEPQTPKASIDIFNYEGEDVFVINFQNFPDGQSAVITTQCEPICVLGGIDGPLNDCSNWDKAIFVETIWVDNR